MSDIERKEFEQAVADKWSDSYKFTRFGDEDYYDEVLEGMWRGWQAGRRALEGQDARLIHLLADIRFACGDDGKRMQGELVEYIGELARKAGELEGEPVGYTNQYQLDKFPLGESGYVFRDKRDDSTIPLYTHPASADVPEKWRTVMKELADDLESEIEARRSGDLDRRIERDLIVVKEARVLLDEQEQGQ
jgi:hypothetical protein